MDISLEVTAYMIVNSKLVPFKTTRSTFKDNKVISPLILAVLELKFYSNMTSVGLYNDMLCLSQFYKI